MLPLYHRASPFKGKVQKMGAWVPSALKNQQLPHGYKHQFLNRIVTGDDKCYLYVNIKQRKEWTPPEKQNIKHNDVVRMV